MQGKKSFVLYSDIWETVKELPLDKRGELFTAILQYANDLNPEITDLLIRVAFRPIKAGMDRTAEKWQERAERSRENGAKGGRPKNPEKPRETQRDILEPRKPVNVSVNVNVPVNDNGKCKVDSTRFLEILKNEEFREELSFKGYLPEAIRDIDRFFSLNESKTFEGPDHLKNSFLKFVGKKTRKDLRTNPKGYQELISGVFENESWLKIIESQFERAGIFESREAVFSEFEKYLREKYPILENSQHVWNILVQFITTKKPNHEKSN